MNPGIQRPGLFVNFGNMYQVFIGSLILSILHALIPNHWIPLIAVSRTEKWSAVRTFWSIIITGFSHTLSTVIIGVIVGFAGYKLASGYSVIEEIIAPSILIALGLVYLFLDFRSHSHHHHEPARSRIDHGNTRWIALITSLSISMFLTPCVEIEAYYFQAGTIGWMGIVIVSAVYVVTTIVVMLSLVFFSLKGIRTFKFDFLEDHEKAVTGSVLVLLGFLAMILHF
jgi:nickel/cobalt transporter (NicO) family protein